MLGVIQHTHVDADGAQCVDEGGQWAVSLAADLGFHSVEFHGRLDDVDAAVDLGADHPLPDTFQRPDRCQVLVGEGVPHLLGGHLTAFAAGTLGDLLNYPAEFDLQSARQHQAVVGLHDVGDSALSGLRVHPDNGLVGAPDVAGIDRQVRHLPQDVVDVGVRLVGGDFHGVEALVDGVLVAAGERGVHQIPAVRVSLVDR